jgi:TolA-binding protein
VVLMIVLAALAGAGLTLGTPIHRLQAKSLEGQHQWEQALMEYQMAGERAPASTDLARVYVQWGEQLSAAHNYGASIDRFNTVLQSYPGVTDAVQQAQKDEISAFFSWGQQASEQKDFQAAASHYDALLGLVYCSADCQTKGSALDATAYYSLAEVSLASGDYSTAVNAFRALLTRFAHSPEAGKIHPDAAKALLGLGKQQRSSSSCASALGTYRELAGSYADTPEGQQANADLLAPEPVTGRFAGAYPYLPGGTPYVALVKGWYVGIPIGQEMQLVHAGYRVGLNPDSSFTFAAIPQGTYDLVFGSEGPGSFLVSYISNSANQLIYVATVGPLCPYDFGTIQLGVP